MISFICFICFGYFGVLGEMRTEKSFFRELEKVMGCTHASSNVNTQIGYADGLDESSRTRSLLVKDAQSTGDPKFLVPKISSVHSTLNSDAVRTLLTFAYSWGEHLLIAGGLL